MAIARELEGEAQPITPLLRLRGQALLEPLDVARLFRVVTRQFELSHQIRHDTIMPRSQMAINNNMYIRHRLFARK